MTATTHAQTQPMPGWFEGLRPHQEEALEQIEVAFEEDGVGCVFVDAPTGSGKTLIGEMARRQMDVSGLYVCSDKALQTQFMRDFEQYAREIKGRNNYPTELRADKTADDCQGGQCFFCESKGSCPYIVAKNAAVAAELAVLNTSYFLHEANGAQPSFGGKARRELVVIDEADLLESALMGFVQFEVPPWIAKMCRLVLPKKGVHKKTLVGALRTMSYKAAETTKGDFLDVKTKRNLSYFSFEALRVAKELEIDVAAGDDDEDAGRWIRDYDTKTLKLTPLIVAPYGVRYLWRHARRFVVMSATIIDAGEMVASLGLPGEWATVEVPMTFPVENRPIVLAPVVDVTYKTMQETTTIKALAVAIERICERHEGERVLVHTGSYKLNNMLRDELLYRLPGDRPVFTYGASVEKADALNKYLAVDNAVLLAASMERGVDLKDDACRVQVIAKIPFPSFGDKRIAGRVRLDGGQHWYNVQTVRELVQMTGRGVRSDTDSCTTYIIDGCFGRLWTRNRSLFPAWWREAVDTTQSVKWLMG